MKKICNKCLIKKELLDFHSHSGTKDGKRSICKKCDRTRNAKWEKQNRARINKCRKEWRKKHTRESRKRSKMYSLLRRESHPWEGHFYGARARCTLPNWSGSKSYIPKKIKFKLTMREVKKMWDRDRASKMNRASIDRINPDSHYEYSNCRFLELSQNSKNAMLLYWERKKWN